MTKEALFDIRYCYNGGDLAGALQEAAEFVKEIGEANVIHVIARLDENVPNAWWVDVIYRVKVERR